MCYILHTEISNIWVLQHPLAPTCLWLCLAIFSSQEVLSLHFSFKLGVTITLLSFFSDTECKLHTYPAGFYYSNSVWEQDHTKVERIIMSQLWLGMVRPWPDQPDQFRRLWQVCTVPHNNAQSLFLVPCTTEAGCDTHHFHCVPTPFLSLI